MTAAAPPTPSGAEILRVFARIGVLSLGGPAAQIALMHRELVEARGWLSEREFLSALSFCMILPGPEAMQLATYAGWRLRGVPGGLVAGGLFVLPGAAVVVALAALYAQVGQVPMVQALFLGVQATVVVIVLEALVRVARRALQGRLAWAIAGAAFAAIFLFAVPFPAIILAAALAGALGLRAAPPGSATAPATPAGGAAGTLRTAALWGALWLGPLAALWLAGAGILAEIGGFFAKMAVISFGGAYALLAWMTQEVVTVRGWLDTPEMIDGLGLAETTPGPLILVTAFVGFLAAFREGGAGLGLAGAAVTLWMVFAPSFLFIFLGAPFMDRIAAAPRLSAALAGVTAAVVGVILNLSVWFAAHVFFAEVGALRAGPVRTILPDLASLDWRAALLALVAGVLLLRFRLGLPLVLLVAAAGGVLLSLP